MSKGENEAEDCKIAIKSKGGDCWHYVLWYGYMLQMLYLMATPMTRLSIYGKLRKYAGYQFRRCVPAGTPCRDRVQSRRPAIQEVRPPCAHISRQRKAHVGVSCVLLLVSSRRYCVIMVSARGIVPCFEEELAYIKQRRSFGLICLWLNILLGEIWSRSKRRIY